MSVLFETQKPSGLSIIPRAYQSEDVSSSFKQWDSGVIGTLTRIFTGGGKTICTAMKFRRWLDQGDNYRCMVISYEKQLVWQFAEELRDVLGIEPGIEMAGDSVNQHNIPSIVVVSRATVKAHKLADAEQKQWLAQRGIEDVGLLTKNAAKQLKRMMAKGMSKGAAQDAIAEHNASYMANHETGNFSRLHKFDWRYNWLVCFDEAHRHVHSLTTVRHIVDWFDRNPASRRTGTTATPKRYDKKSLGTRMFPGISIDYPLYSLTGPCAVKEGYAVPYIQKFVNVEGVDFANLKRNRGGTDFDEPEMEAILRQEEMLASLIEPTLELVEDRRTLVFSPGVQMARDVAAYINARRKCECSCGKKAWHPKRLISDGAKCSDCGEWITDANIVGNAVDAEVVWGSVSPNRRKDIYRGHQNGSFQFLSVCGLCREAYNDPDIAAVAVFRVVSKKASSLAEQMKGRGSRPLKGLIEGLATAEERLEAIRNSAKPNCLIIDLTGITGLPDCASTAQIYAEGLPDEVIDRAVQLELDGDVEDVAEAIQQAQDEIAEERERQRLEREEQQRRDREAAEERARLRPTVTYTTHEVGATASDAIRYGASLKQIKYIGFLGLDLFDVPITKNQASRIIGQLKDGKSIDEVKYTNGLPDDVGPALATAKQIKFLNWKGIPYEQGVTQKEASDLIDRHKNPLSYPQDEVSVSAIKVLIDDANDHDTLTKIARRLDAEGLSARDRQMVVEYGKRRRQELDDRF